MICTEEEAKTKWCPFARSYQLPDAGPVAVNRYGKGPDSECLCIGSACMFWVSRRGESYSDNGVPKRRPDSGYCGAIAAAYTPSSTI